MAETGPIVRSSLATSGPLTKHASSSAENEEGFFKVLVEHSLHPRYHSRILDLPFLFEDEQSLLHNENIV